MNLKIGDTCTVDQAMSLAIQTARRGDGFVSPNPNVGCVVLNQQSQIIGLGYHQKYGGPHAEVEALSNLKPDQLQGAKVIVTLEPCAHEGKTPSCAKMLAKMPISEVIYGLQDPNPLVSGQGQQILLDAGIKSSEYQGELKSELEEVAETFLLNFREKKVWVSLKVAVSLDGALALSSGVSKWITSAEAREYSHYLRAKHDAILVGVNTLLQDNPSLDIRHSMFPGKQNKVVILDPFARGLERLKSGQILSTHDPINVILVVGPEAKTAGLPAGVQVLGVPWIQGTKVLDLTALNQKLWEIGIRSLLVEGGAATFSEFLKQNQAHRLYQFIAPIILGGQSLTWTRGLEISEMSQKKTLKWVKTQAFGPDFLISGRLF